MPSIRNSYRAPDAIPVYFASGRLENYYSAEYVLANRAQFEVNVSRRGHLRSAKRRQRRALVPLSNKGDSFIQEIGCGSVWALRGVRGSERKSQDEAA